MAKCTIYSEVAKMRIKTVFKRISIFFLAFVLLSFFVFFSFNRPIKVHAEPITGSIAVCAAIVSFLSAYGITLTANGAGGQGLQQSVEEITDGFEYYDKTLSDFYNDDTAVNFIIGKDNALKATAFSYAFSNWCNALGDWLIGEYNIGSVPVPIFTRNTLNFKSGNYLYYTTSQLQNNDIADLQTSLPVLGAGNTQTVVVNDHYSFTIAESKYYNRYWRVTVTPYYDGVAGTPYSNSIGEYDPLGAHKILFTEGTDTVTEFGISFCVNSSRVWTYNVSHSAVAGQVSSTSITTEGVLNDGYDDFQQALSDAQADSGATADSRIGIGVTDVPITHPHTKENIATNILDYAAEYGLTGTLVGGYENDKEAEDDNAGTYAPSGEVVGGNIVLVNGLEDFFPFCIPFDLYEIINLLNVPAEAPKFDWKMNFAGRVDDYDITIDLTPYNTVASIFRIMIIIVFLIFLTIKTRDLIRG